MKRLIVIQIFIVAIGFTGCSFDSSEHDLGSGYHLLGNEGHLNVCKELKNKTEKYEDVILGKVVDYDFDGKFILIFRDASERVQSYFNSVVKDDSLWNKQQGKANLQYWIIEKDKDIIFGPLEKAEYFIKRKELKVSENLNLKK